MNTTQNEIETKPLGRSKEPASMCADAVRGVFVSPYYVMGTDPAFLFYPGDYLRDTQCLSEAVQVAYDRIMCEHMRNICISQRRLDFFTKRLSDEEKTELMSVLSETEGGWCIKWVAESVEKRRAYSVSRSKNRKKSYDAHMKTYVHHMENEIENANEDENEDVNRTALEKKSNIAFDVFWDAYDKKVGDKRKLVKKWEALTDEQRIAVMEHIPRYKAGQPDKQYRKNPETYLNNQSWNDEIIQANNGTNRQSTSKRNNAPTVESNERLRAALEARRKS